MRTVLILAVSVAILSNVAPAYSQGYPSSSSSSAQRLTGHIMYSRVSPPQSGVKLLEDIFQRVRTQPQVAMAKLGLKQQAQEIFTQTAQAQGPTDYRLAIRPKATGKNQAAPSPSLQLLQPQQMQIATSEAGATSSSIVPPSPPISPASQIATAFSGNNQNAGYGYYAAPSPQSEVWLGSHPRKASDPPGYPSKPTLGFWESSANEAMRAAGANASYPTAPVPVRSITLEPFPADKREQAQSRDREVQSTRRSNLPAAQRGAPVQDLNTSLGRLQGLSMQLDEAQRQISNMSPASGKKATILKAKAPGNTFLASKDAEEATDYFDRKEKEKSRERKMDKSQESDGDAILDSLKEKESNYKTQNKTQIAYGRDMIALLPPNVVTGIPLVRLGISEGQANNALQTVGTMKQQKLNKWTVWSWQKPQTKAAALQLYMRNGLLDAMRIFDPSLIASDFGVSLGDDLSTVKSKFGEPAFILTEPVPGAGQNYIYPISQVAFQLARPAPDQDPRVVSVMIFNVK